jgi:hypothetical protein
MAEMIHQKKVRGTKYEVRIRTSYLVLRTFLRASSILEVTVALVIISLVFGMFMMIYMNILSGDLYLQKMKYEGKLALQYNEIIRLKDFTDGVKEDGTVRIFQKIIPYKDDATVKLIELKAITPEGKVLAQRKQLHYVGP